MTAEQFTTLIDYIAKAGDQWRTSLAADWRRGGTQVHGIEYAYLAQLRNNLGPKWLKTFQPVTDRDLLLNNGNIARYVETDRFSRPVYDITLRNTHRVCCVNLDGTYLHSMSVSGEPMSPLAKSFQPQELA